MCSTTKQRIADAMRQLMAEKPIEKITVRNLMDATNMKRQSFYYHFKDTRDVLMWVSRQELIEPMSAMDLEFTDWVVAGMRILAADRVFYRKVLGAVYEEFVTEFDRNVMIPRVRALLYPGTGELDDNRSFTVEFIAEAFTNRMIRFVRSRIPLDEGRIRERIEFLLKGISGR